MRYVPQAAHAQDERRRSSCETWPLLLGFRFLDFVWEIHFRYRNAKIKLWKWKWTSVNSTRGCFCVLCVMWAQFVACLSEFLVWCCSRCCSIYSGPSSRWEKTIWPLLSGFWFIDFVWEIHFRYQNAKIKLSVWKWTSHGVVFVSCV